MKPISVQLYSLREECKVNFPAVLERLAAIGYIGVEPAGFHGMSPVEFKQRVDDLGLVVSSTHSPWAKPDNLQEVVETLGILGTRYVAAGKGPADFQDMDALKRSADEFETIAKALARHDITLTVHNHAWEFEMLDGRLKYEWLAERAPSIRFELDTYWAANFGANDPAEMVRRFAPRCPLLHIKDGPLVKDAAMTAVGSGKMPMPRVIAAATAATEWLVVELDKSDTDMFGCIEKSYDYLIGQGLARGNR
jgi:sugar phosphate isomerase/epimerase